MPVPVIAGQRRGGRGRRQLRAGLRHDRGGASASFIQAFSKIGLVPDCGGTWLLPRLVGRARALGLAMTGDKLQRRPRPRPWA
jgi:2-(1,2-epoxy-1,2-dihydrophenyl)acetyl-CoA isomerase